jgi:beta-lactamase regulating signal transducer with metallopeptidase domain
MIWTILLILLILWLLGLVSGYMVDSVIHIPLFVAIVAMLIKIEDDCSNYGSCLTKKMNFKRHLISNEQNREEKPL